MNQIIKVDKQLPATIEGLHKFIIIGHGKLEAYRNALQSMDKIQSLDDGYMQRRAELLEQAQNFGRTIIGAEQQFGVMLKEIFPSKVNLAYKVNFISLKDYGISLNESMRARALYDEPEQVNEAIDEAIEIGDIPTPFKAWFKIQTYRKEKAKQDLRDELARQGKEIELTESRIQLINNDFRKVDIEEDSVDLIFTDPPYGGEYLDLWSDLGEFANRVLKPSAFLVSYAGHMYLPTWINNLSEHLTYYWIFCLYHTGQIGVCQGRNMECQWKPILIFQKEPFKKIDKIVNDYVENDVRQKGLHDWQQGESGAGKLVEIFSKEGDLICDPMMGSGTFPIVAYKKNRRAIGIEIEQDVYWMSKKRLNDVIEEEVKTND